MSAVVATAIGCLVALAGPTAALASSCPNEPLRLGPSALLPGCRAYEMVSPVDKNKGNVSPAYNAFTSPSGESAAFSSISAFAGASGAVLQTTYLARRGQTDWSTEGTTPPNFNTGSSLTGVLSPVSSPDMTKTLQYTSTALTPGAIEGGTNVYVRDNLTGTRELVAAFPNRKLLDKIGYQEHFYVTGNSDWSSMLFESHFALTADAEETKESTVNLYEFQDGAFELVDRQPEDEVTHESPPFPAGVAPIATSNPNATVISSDGSRVFFTPVLATEPGEASQPGAGTLFMRETRGGASRTVPISTVQVPGPEDGDLAPGAFGATTADGSVVYFTSTANLTPDANLNQANAALYRYEVSSGKLTDMTPVPNPSNPNVFGLGEDGSDLYFFSSEALAEGASETSGANLYVLDSSGEIEWIAAVNPTQTYTSRNGRFFAFTSFAQLTEDAKLGSEADCPTDPFLGNPPGECFEVYRFDADRGALECLSCNGMPPTGSSFIGGLRIRHEEFAGFAAPEAVLDDGTVYLETTNALLPGDVNEAKDVYSVGNGAPELVSTGTSPQPSSFGDATPTGSSVFFFTAQPLVKSDVDASVDLYVDRDGGGLAAQWPPGAPGVCEGEGCRGEVPGAPTPLASAGGEGCDALIVNSERSSASANALARKARKAGHGKTAAAKRRASHLRRQARTQRLKAKRIERQAKLCRRQGK